MSTHWTRAVACIALWAAVAAAEAGEKVALRAASGRFLRACDDGAVRVDRLYPLAEDAFELLPLDGGAIALKAPGGRFLLAEGRDARTLRADSPRSEPGPRETFVLGRPEGNRVGLKARGYRDFVVIEDALSSPAASPPERSGPGEAVEIYRTDEVPGTLQTALAMIVQGLVSEELVGKEYDKTRTRTIEKYVDVPSPTLRDLRHTKRHRVLATEEQERIKARLDGPPQITITHMPYLQGHFQEGTGMLMFAAEASLPFRGQVSYKVPNALSATTSFQAVARLSMVGQFTAQKAEDQLTFCPPELRELKIELRLVDIANDVLNLARKPIEDLINREIRHNDERIRQQANDALAKALKARQIENPLGRFLGWP